MKIPTSYLRTTAIAVLAAGLVGCGGGGGGSDIPTASNAAITPPPTTAVAITAGTDTPTVTKNKTIASAAFQALDNVGSQTIGNASGPLLAFGIDTKPAAA